MGGGFGIDSLRYFEKLKVSGAIASVPFPLQDFFPMRRQNGIHLRLDPTTMARVDALTKGEPSNRTRILREGVELRLSFEAHAEMLREAIENTAAESLNALRLEATLLMRGQAEATKTAQEELRRLMREFLEAMGEGSVAETTKPAGVRKGPHGPGATQPSTAVQLPARPEK